MKPIIAAQCYTIRDFMQNDEQFDESMKKLKKIGFNTVQLSGHLSCSASAITKSLKENGLTCCITHSPWDRLWNDFDAIVKEHKDWGCNVIAVGGMPGGFDWSIDGFKRFTEKANEIGNKLATVGMKFAYHNHSGEFVRYEGGTRGMDIILANGNENFLLEPDCFWLQYAGMDVREFIENAKGRISTIHFKDCKFADNKPQLCEIGVGNMNYKGIIDSCVKAGVEFAAIEQDTCPGDPFESLEISYKELKRLGL